MSKNITVRHKKVLLVGLGRLGGGVAAARFFVEQGARLTVSDALTKDILRPSLNKLKDLPITYELGIKTPTHISGYDMVVCNQAVSINSEVVRLAKKARIPYFNDLTTLLSLLEGTPHQPYIGVTGTRGKTTVTTWIGHLIKPSIVGGNMPRNGSFTIFNKIKNKPNLPVALELSSFQLEYVQKGMEAPRVAVVTNLYQDHLNRHGTMEEYARCKANLFINQSSKDVLILNADDAYTKKFLSFKPRAMVWMVSRKKLSKGVWGMYEQKGICYLRDASGVREIIRVPEGFKDHQIYNLMEALCAARAYGKEWSSIVKRVATLPQIPFRQQVVLQTKKYVVINDSAATSPEGAVAAIRAYVPKDGVYACICGGTDKQLDFSVLARTIKEKVNPKKLFLLQGSGTQKLVEALKKEKYNFIVDHIFETLGELVLSVRRNTPRGIIIFSPACASFEKFKNEFHRGRQFTKLVKRYFSEN